MNIRHKIYDHLVRLKADFHGDEHRGKNCLDGLFAFPDDGLQYEVKVFRNRTYVEVVAVHSPDGHIEKSTNDNLDLNISFYRRLTRYSASFTPIE